MIEMQYAVIAYVTSVQSQSFAVVPQNVMHLEYSGTHKVNDKGASYITPVF